jgi:apolipoprotein D and lipocalin family protein
MRRLVLIASAFAAGAAIVAAQRAVAESKPSELATVRSVDLKRYMGTWYEIARYPNRFQRDCESDSLATYTLRNDGKVEVVNSCRKANGKVKEARGKAKVVDGSNARLKVTFFWPFYGDYWIIGLDPDYRWVVVGEPSRKYLWILSRTPKMTDADYHQALQIIRASGYNPAKLVNTPQSTRR